MIMTGKDFKTKRMPLLALLLALVMLTLSMSGGNGDRNLERVTEKVSKRLDRRLDILEHHALRAMADDSDAASEITEVASATLLESVVIVFS